LPAIQLSGSLNGHSGWDRSGADGRELAAYGTDRLVDRSAPFASIPQEQDFSARDGQASGVSSEAVFEAEWPEDATDSRALDVPRTFSATQLGLPRLTSPDVDKSQVHWEDLLQSGNPTSDGYFNGEDQVGLIGRSRDSHPLTNDPVGRSAGRSGALKDLDAADSWRVNGDYEDSWDKSAVLSMEIPTPFSARAQAIMSSAVRDPEAGPFRFRSTTSG